MSRSRKFCQGGILTIFSLFFNSQRAVQITLKKQLDPMGPIASPGGSVPEYLRKPIATCDFPGGGGGGG